MITKRRTTAKITILVIVVAFVAACSDRGSFSKDYLERGVKVGDKSYAYRVLVPKQRTANTKLPVMLYLHGSGSRGDDNYSQIEGFDVAVFDLKEGFDFIVVLPQCKQDSFWAAKDMAGYAMAVLDDAVLEFNGDPDRLYLAGFSMGGHGTWQIAGAHPGKFAALVPVAGGIVGERPAAPRDREAIIPEVLKMLDSTDPYKAVAAAIGPTPVWAFHGTKDESVPVEFTRKAVEAMRDAGYPDVKYSEYEGEKHLIFSKAIREPGLMEWLAGQKLNNLK